MSKSLSSEWRIAGSICLVAIGILIGLAVKFPAGWELSDVNANVAGSAIGSIASIAGAFLLLRKQIQHDRQLASEAQARESMAERAKVEALRDSLANAMFTDLVAVEAMVQKSIELEAKHTMSPNQQDKWLRRLQLLPTPAFDQFCRLIPKLGDNLGPVLMHCYGEILRLRAITQGQALMNDGPIDTSDFVVQLARQNLRLILKNLDIAKAELHPYTRFIEE